MNITEIGNSVVKDVQTRNHKSAAEKIQSLLDCNANLKEKWGGITRLAVTIGELEQAKSASQKFLALAPNDPRRIVQCAAILAEIRQVDAAINMVLPLLETNRTPEVLHFLGTVYTQVGEVKLAKKYLIELLEKNPDSGISWLTLSAIHHFDEQDPLFEKLSTIQNTQTQVAPYWFALGKACLDIDDKKLAFSYFKKANQLMRNTQYIPSQHRKFVDEIIENQNTQFIENIIATELSDKTDPIFIIGIPRSGTTLLQQMLSAHSKLNEGGELKCLTYPTSEVGQAHINNVNNLDSEEQKNLFDKFRTDYFYYLEQQIDSVLPCIDKSLDLNHHLGVITKSFPNAPIIRIVRDAKDTAWSCYRAFFNQGIAWSYDLENIAEYFYHENRLSEHWSNILTDRILEISYEELVNNPTETLTKCLEHIGLDFESEMLSFYKNKSLVQTSSVKQVRSPINIHSIDATKSITEELKAFTNRYELLLNRK
ncbi:tetratricopeptide repeat-containing sulfotransferase family protein [Pseudocolwellia agarivorans]|uniref:tetratricopeptide repeat-containing sulfotransferase family protein n=1 Tax=Pseudocolwellia agarivorans TaxID=1911682 RepID=UPI003F8809B7